MAHFFGIPASQLDKWRARVDPWIEGACKRHGLMNADYVYDRIEDRNWQLWVAVEDTVVIAVLVTEIRNFPLGWECNFVIGTGKHREKWQHFRHVVAEWAKAHGCCRMRLEARTGWAKIFKGYKRTHVILEMEL